VLSECVSKETEREANPDVVVPLVLNGTFDGLWRWFCCVFCSRCCCYRCCSCSSAGSLRLGADKVEATEVAAAFAGDTEVDAVDAALESFAAAAAATFP
jgi:hypothetical protein